MSRPQEPHKPTFPFGNPFRFMRPKGSYTSPQLLTLLNKFEENLSGRFAQLMPKDGIFTFTLSWMMLAMNLLSQTHNDVKSLITDLELPVSDWDDKWIDVYLGNTVNLLDICIAFSSEISRLSQGQLLVQCLLHNLNDKKLKEFSKVESSLNSWWQHIASKNQRVVKCSSVIDQLVQSIDLPKIKNSAKGKVLMRAMYGVRVQSVFVCNIFISSFTGSSDKLFDLHVSEKYSWAEAYNSLQSCVNREIRDLKASKCVIEELTAVDESAKALLCLTKEVQEPGESEALNASVSALKTRTEILSGGFDELAKELDGFFQIVLSGRDALLCNLRTVGFSEISDHKKELVNL